MTDAPAPRPQPAAQPAAHELRAIAAACRRLGARIGRFRRAHPAESCRCPLCRAIKLPDYSGSDLHDSLALVQGALAHGAEMIECERPLTADE